MPFNETDTNKEVGTFEDFFAEAINEGSAETPDEDGGVGNEVVDEHSDDDVQSDTNVNTSEAPNTADSQTQDIGNGDATDYRSLYEQERQRTKSWEGRLSARDRENNALKEELEKYRKLVQQKEDEDDSKEDETVKAFLEEFPELAAPIQKLIEKATRKTSKTVVSDIESRVQEHIAPIATTVQEVTLEKHLNTIRTAHNDFDEIVKSGDVQKWIDEQPEFMKPSLQRVYEQGYATEVVELLSQYKRGRNISLGPNGQVIEQKQPVTRRPAAAVKSRPSAPQTKQDKIDPDDFDSAWEAALRSNT